ncbi:MAG TPA: FAD-dependent oxidoreductase [Solirubrobacterales bacterium]|nr:FAD-dependent oxidoreductase [Solirubrobacterales bacterium]
MVPQLPRSNFYVHATNVALPSAESRGCYGCLMTTGGWTEYGRALREPVGRLHWVGAETATAWNGYMDGAVSSGERVAAEALAQIR